MSIYAQAASRHTGLIHDLRRIDFLNVSEDALQHLTDFCEPATFGLNQQDVLDESYRKARKLDNTHFSVTLDLERAGILDAICSKFLVDRHETRPVVAELYKLNVYGSQRSSSLPFNHLPDASRCREAIVF